MPAAKKSVTVIPPPSEDLVRVRAEGIKLFTPIRGAVESLVITSEEDYLQADFLLARIKNARATWASKMQPIVNPLKSVLAKAKEAMLGVKTLNDGVDSPLELLEGKVKGAMKTFKLEEARQLQEAQAEADREADRLRAEAEKKATAALSARTPQMKAKLEQARADLDAAAQSVQAQAVQDTQPIRGAASTTRTVTKVRIDDPLTFLAAMTAYTPKAGLYQMGHPALSLFTHKVTRTGELTPEGSALEVLTSELMKVFATQPGVLDSWPGVTIFQDIIIANR